MYKHMLLRMYRTKLPCMTAEKYWGLLTCWTALNAAVRIGFCYVLRCVQTARVLSEYLAQLTVLRRYWQVDGDDVRFIAS
jgi:hypothetical protein